jgi:hypothetical protein
MAARVLFIQGGGNGAYDVDAKLVEALRNELGPEYEVRYPQMPNESKPDYNIWTRRIADELADMRDGAILVGHSIGASIAIKWLTERKPERSLAGVFLIATPFWGDLPPWQWKDVQLSPDARLPRGLPLFLYHGSDDETVPFGHLALYEKVFPQAHVRRLQERNHQLNNNLAEVASDIRSLT